MPISGGAGWGLDIAVAMHRFGGYSVLLQEAIVQGCLALEDAEGLLDEVIAV